MMWETHNYFDQGFRLKKLYLLLTEFVSLKVGDGVTNLDLANKKPDSQGSYSVNLQ